MKFTFVSKIFSNALNIFICLSICVYNNDISETEFNIDDGKFDKTYDKLPTVIVHSDAEPSDVIVDGVDISTLS